MARTACNNMPHISWTLVLLRRSGGVATGSWPSLPWNFGRPCQTAWDQYATASARQRFTGPAENLQPPQQFYYYKLLTVKEKLVDYCTYKQPFGERNGSGSDH